MSVFRGVHDWKRLSLSIGVVLVAGVLAGLTAVRMGEIALYGAVALLTAIVILRSDYFGIIIVLGLFVGFAGENVTSVNFGAKTLFLSPGEIALLLVLFIAGFRAAFARRFAIHLPNGSLPFARPFVVLALVFFSSTLLAGTFFGYGGNLALSLLWYTRWLMSLCIFVLAANGRFGPGKLKPLLISLAIVLLIGFVYSLASAPGGLSAVYNLTVYDRSNGVFPDPNQFGQVAAFLAIMLTALELMWHAGSGRIITLICVGCLAGVVLFTQSREALISMVVGVFTMSLFLLKRRWARLLLPLLLIGAVYLVTQSPRFVDTLATVSDGQTVVALNGRTDTWATAGNVFLNHPLTGIGFENLSRVSNGLVWEAHNGFLQAAVVSGAGGLVTYVWLLCALGRGLYQRVSQTTGARRAGFTGLFCVFVGYVVTAIVSDHFITFYIYNVVFWGVFGLLLSTAGGETNDYTAVSVPAV